MNMCPVCSFKSIAEGAIFGRDDDYKMFKSVKQKIPLALRQAQ